MSQMILFLTHKNNHSIKVRFDKIKRDVLKRADIYVLTDNPVIFGKEWWPVLSFKDLNIQYLRNNWILDIDMDLARLALWQVLKKNSIKKDYQYYWLIEYDVYYNWNWDDILKIEDAADLLATHIKKYSKFEKRCWPWWKTFSWPEKFKSCNLTRCFLPMFRISKKGIDVLDCALRRHWDWQWHFECLIPTILLSSGCIITELGWSSGYTPLSRKGKFYKNFPWNLDAWLWTFRWIPLIGILYRKNTLYHPVKSFYCRFKALKYAPRMFLKFVYFSFFIGNKKYLIKNIQQDSQFL